jgi:hypothetical protein
MPADFKGFDPEYIKKTFGESSIPAVDALPISGSTVGSTVASTVGSTVGSTVASTVGSTVGSGLIPGDSLNMPGNSIPESNLYIPSPVFVPTPVNIFSSRAPSAPSAPSGLSAPSAPSAPSRSSLIVSDVSGVSGALNAQDILPSSGNQIYKYTYNIEVDSELSRDYIIATLKDEYSSKLNILKTNINIVLSQKSSFTNTKYEMYVSTIIWTVDLTINGSNNNSIRNVIERTSLGPITNLKTGSSAPMSKVIIPNGSTIVYTTSNNIISYKLLRIRYMI